MAVKSVLFFIALLAFSCIIQSSSAEPLTLKNLKTEETLNNQNLEKTDIIDEIDEYIKVFLEAAKISPMINYTDNCTDANRDLAKGLIDSINNAQSKGFNEDSYLQITESLGAAQPISKYAITQVLKATKLQLSILQILRTSTALLINSALMLHMDSSNGMNFTLDSKKLSKTIIALRSL